MEVRNDFVNHAGPFILLSLADEENLLESYEARAEGGK